MFCHAFAKLLVVKGEFYWGWLAQKHATHANGCETHSELCVSNEVKSEPFDDPEDYHERHRLRGGCKIESDIRLLPSNTRNTKCGVEYIKSRPTFCVDLLPNLLFGHFFFLLSTRSSVRVMMFFFHSTRPLFIEQFGWTIIVQLQSQENNIQEQTNHLKHPHHCQRPWRPSFNEECCLSLQYIYLGCWICFDAYLSVLSLHLICASVMLQSTRGQNEQTKNTKKKTKRTAHASNCRRAIAVPATPKSHVCLASLGHALLLTKKKEANFMDKI